MNQKLYEAYIYRMMEEPVDLEKFVEEIKRGDYGHFKREEIVEFLYFVEEQIIKNIYAKSVEIHFGTGEVEEAIERTRRRIKKLVEEL